jgi:hypothetical protein
MLDLSSQVGGEERSIFVPTRADQVRDALRYLNEPWILFGEEV